MPHPGACAICADPLGAGGIAPEDSSDRCGRCILDPPPFLRLVAAAPYRGSARSILLAFKFRGADFLARHLARVMIERLRLEEPVGEVVSVPATSRSRRGRDHAADLLASAVAHELGLPFAARRLTKVRATERQSALPASERARNVRGAFRARGHSPENVLLVDDVATSGSTARECSRALLRAGAAAIEVWCFARASREDLPRPAADVRASTLTGQAPDHPEPGAQKSESTE